jgi:hypothetical protein
MITRIEAKPHHCGQLSRSLRAQHLEALSESGAMTHRELRTAFDHSVIRQAWALDGRLCALAGVTGTAASSEGTVWFALTDEAAKSRNHVSREALRFLKRAMATRSRLTTIVLAKDKAGVSFAYFLGFKALSRAKIGGADVIEMAYTQMREVA